MDATRTLVRFCFAMGDFSLAHQVELKPPDGVRSHQVALETAKMKGVEGALDDKGAALHA